jgi:DNA-binding response OmpR family regulator
MKKKILFIEDERALQKTLGDYLKSEGYKVISAFDGESALKLAFSEEPDLILLDLVIPKITGFEVLEKLKNDQKTKSIPVIVLTNLEQPGDVDRALALGATTYLVKANYSLQEVVEKIKSFI